MQRRKEEKKTWRLCGFSEEGVKKKSNECRAMSGKEENSRQRTVSRGKISRKGAKKKDEKRAVSRKQLDRSEQ